MDSLTKPTLNNVEVYVDNTYDEDLLTSNFHQDCLSIPWSNWLQTWLEVLYPHLPLADSYELSLKFVSDRQMQTLNYQYRQQNKPTDVLAFASLEANVPQPKDTSYLLEPLYLGDLVISLDTAAKQAQQQGHSLRRELAWLSAHGLLHLLGWDHPDDSSLQKMLDLQTELLDNISIITQESGTFTTIN